MGNYSFFQDISSKSAANSSPFFIPMKILKRLLLVIIIPIIVSIVILYLLIILIVITPIYRIITGKNYLDKRPPKFIDAFLP